MILILHFTNTCNYHYMCGVNPKRTCIGHCSNCNDVIDIHVYGHFILLELGMVNLNCKCQEKGYFISRYKARDKPGTEGDE